MNTLIKARQWIKETFEDGSRPSINTVKKWYENGEIKGVLLGGTLYIERSKERAILGGAPEKRTWSVKKKQ